MNLGIAEFAVMVFDINGLKIVNDTYGHDFGDLFIRESCKIICETFKRSPIYRIGGDEFVAILENTDYENRDYLISLFAKDMDKAQINGEICSDISMAYGVSVYNKEKDMVFANVFKRADEAMYENKKNMKNQK